MRLFFLFFCLFFSCREPSIKSYRIAKKNQLQWQAPKSWKKLPKEAMRIASFSSTNNSHISLSFLENLKLDELANVNRWRKQIGAKAWQKKDLHRNRQLLKGRITPLLFFDLKGPKESIMVAIYEKPSGVWFFKWVGNTSKREIEKETFIQFVQSIQEVKHGRSSR